MNNAGPSVVKQDPYQQGTSDRVIFAHSTLSVNGVDDSSSRTLREESLDEDLYYPRQDPNHEVHGASSRPEPQQPGGRASSYPSGTRASSLTENSRRSEVPDATSRFLASLGQTIKSENPSATERFLASLGESIKGEESDTEGKSTPIFVGMN